MVLIFLFDQARDLKELTKEEFERFVYHLLT
ncbi:hypothetical protein C8N25_12769 [Algoriphagus antarcticus]|uniref:Uncharacterized protein n=1 Tax=Algoriphagus antarcticus TaxID=238540 RepID=A0A3E0DFF3_9BACT|nr:hypothetical protein C8N25_12769 [Algoriphagus antarcticus]